MCGTNEFNAIIFVVHPVPSVRPATRPSAHRAACRPEPNQAQPRAARSVRQQDQAQLQCRHAAAAAAAWQPRRKRSERRSAGPNESVAQVPDDLQADRAAGARRRMQTLAVLRSGNVFADQLGARRLALSGVQVSNLPNRYAKRVSNRIPPAVFLRTVKPPSQITWKSISTTGAFWNPPPIRTPRTLQSMRSPTGKRCGPTHR